VASQTADKPHRKFGGVLVSERGVEAYGAVLRPISSLKGDTHAPPHLLAHDAHNAVVADKRMPANKVTADRLGLALPNV
jgi:hypothetical protein